ncbi:myo-inositol oxygenase [Nitzschia inconspicua]|uniref:Inositol oxygenase n=1 Tax=Nitzschia inconspicua TaxID=303405 RepID=A0A9K3KZW8_9STRA|nr:myo-inositol oxygenase [Nitzschia inconspicua]
MEHRQSKSDKAQDPTEERILLFRSDQAGSIGKVVFSIPSKQNKQIEYKDESYSLVSPPAPPIIASINVLSVQERYRGFDFGGLLFCEALAYLQRQYCDDSKMILCSLVAKEDVRRQGKLVAFYQRLGAKIKDGAKRSLVNNNDQETYEGIPMEVALSKTYNCDCDPSPSLITSSIASFLPVTFLALDTRGKPVPLTNFKTSYAWLLVEKKNGEVVVQSTRQGTSNGKDCSRSYFQVLPWLETNEVKSKPNYLVWIIRSITDGLYLDSDMYTSDICRSRSPTYWQIYKDANHLSLVKTKESPSWRNHYRCLWSTQTVSFIKEMHRKYSDFDTCKLSILDALELARDLPADKYSGSDVSVRTLSFAMAEMARNEGHPDWVQFVALVQTLGCLLKIHNPFAFGETGKEFDWTITGAESRVVGSKAPDCCAYVEFRRLNPDEKDPQYSTYLGMYERNVGLENVLLNWSSNEYMYYMLKYNKVSLPEDAFKILKFIPLVDWHSRKQYRHFSTTDDEKVREPVVDFYNICLNAKRCILKTGKDLSDTACQSLWHSHYAFVVRKYVGVTEKLSW